MTDTEKKTLTMPFQFFLSKCTNVLALLWCQIKLGWRTNVSGFTLTTDWSSRSHVLERIAFSKYFVQFTWKNLCWRSLNFTLKSFPPYLFSSELKRFREVFCHRISSFNCLCFGMWYTRYWWKNFQTDTIITAYIRIDMQKLRLGGKFFNFLLSVTSWTSVQPTTAGCQIRKIFLWQW